MHKHIEKEFNEIFTGMDAEYKSIIDRFKRNISTLSQYKLEIANTKSAEYEKEAKAEIQKLKDDYWAKASRYLDDETTRAANKDLKNPPKNIEELLQDNMEMMLLEKELPMLDQTQIKEKYDQGRDPVKRLILANLRVGQQERPEYKHLFNELNKTPQDVINELKGKIKWQQAYNNKVYTDAVLPHDIDIDLGTNKRLSDAYFTNLVDAEIN